MRPRVYVTQPIALSAAKRLRAVARVTVNPDSSRPLPKKNLIAAAKKADILFSLLHDRVDRDVLAANPKLRAVCSMAITPDAIDVAEATARGIPVTVVYSAFKAAITGFTRSLALDLAPSGIRVNAIAPETTETEQVKPSAFILPQYREHVRRWNPLGRFGVPTDAAGCAVFLASELSAWMTGTTLHLDGGALAAGGWYRTPDERWTIVPVISDSGLSF